VNVTFITRLMRFILFIFYFLLILSQFNKRSAKSAIKYLEENVNM
jgi:hypothetical protein